LRPKNLIPIFIVSKSSQDFTAFLNEMLCDPRAVNTKPLRFTAPKITLAIYPAFPYSLHPDSERDLPSNLSSLETAAGTFPLIKTESNSNAFFLTCSMVIPQGFSV
jgi:hypothetical protein